MKGFIVSYITSVVLLVAVCFSSILAAPMEILPRLIVYYSFPLAVSISLLSILYVHATAGLVNRKTVRKGSIRNQLSTN
ncbi:hypothetical protein KKI24_09860 [bacterium]|nr:hypothetical protein [bacterium]